MEVNSKILINYTNGSYVLYTLENQEDHRGYQRLAFSFEECSFTYILDRSFTSLQIVLLSILLTLIILTP